MTDQMTETTKLPEEKPDPMTETTKLSEEKPDTYHDHTALVRIRGYRWLDIMVIPLAIRGSRRDHRLFNLLLYT